ncbi:unnamed protein product [Pneumocystis jirovecii]|uniref:Uncharacterized protein n=1 Tax=Pneumocystis jirovecii TaxID=42068 RepID=L0P8F6_PNEJI|nr:unnamed protein product [Pneumocystis jirovecii]
MNESVPNDHDLQINIYNDKTNTHVSNEKQLNKILSKEKIEQTAMEFDYIVKDIPQKPILSYNPNELTWNSTHTINLEHKYCYCSQDRTLDEPDFQCRGIFIKV